MSECIITRRGGGAFSTLPVLNENYPKDKSVTFISGDTATASFEVKIDVDGKPAEYTYQWYVDGQPVSGATNSSFTIYTNDSSVGTHSVYCDVTNEAGTVLSRTATLSVVMYYTPVLNPNFPADFSCMTNNGTHTFNVEFAEHGYPADYTYKWYWDGSLLDWATKETCTVSLAHGASTHAIYCEVTNKAGTVRSRTATITLRDTYLWNWADVNLDITGGWTLSSALQAGVGSGVQGTISVESTKLTLRLPYASGTTRDGFVRTYHTINLTHYSKIRFYLYMYTSNTSYIFKVGATTQPYNAYSYVAAQTQVPYTGEGWYTVDVDISGLSGSYYVGVFGHVYDESSYVHIGTAELIL